MAGDSTAIWAMIVPDAARAPARRRFIRPGACAESAMTPALKVLPGGKEERETLRELYLRYGAAVRSRCAFLLKDPADAEDAMQEVFAKALTHLAGFRAEASPVTWLVRIATHYCLNLLRARRASWRDEVVRLARARPEGGGGAERIEGRDLVRVLLGRFDAEAQAAAVHYYLDEMTLEEVAHAIGRSVPTVRKRLAEFAAVAREELSRPCGVRPLGREENHG